MEYIIYNKNNMMKEKKIVFFRILSLVYLFKFIIINLFMFIFISFNIFIGFFSQGQSIKKLNSSYVRISLLYFCKYMNNSREHQRIRYIIMFMFYFYILPRSFLFIISYIYIFYIARLSSINSV